MPVVTLYPEPQFSAEEVICFRRIFAIHTPEQIVRFGLDITTMRAAVAQADAQAPFCLRSSVHAGARRR